MNPIEKFWGWIRRERRRRDLKDLNMKKAALTKPQYRARVRAVLRTRKAQTFAKNIAKSLKKACADIVLKKGAASRG
jgi:hypothetical protein